MPFTSKNDVLEYLHKVFGDIEIVEATIPLRLQPMPEDAAGADAKDPSNCILVHTAHRQYGAEAAVFWKNVAYIDMIGEDGVRRVERFSVPRKTLNLITKFDHGEPFQIGTALRLSPPARSGTLRAKRKERVRRLRKNKKQIDRRKQLELALARKAKAAKLAAQRLAKAQANLKLDDKARAEVRKRKEAADLAMKKAKAAVIRMDQKASGRRPRAFDLTTRNGAAGHYNFAGRKSAPLPPAA